MKPLYSIIGCILLCTAICFYICLRERRKSRKLLENVLQELDNAIAGNLLETTYDESLDAAIRERLNRVVQIAGMQRDKAEKERDTVKSLISDISHQVRTPLSNILLYSELLEESVNSAFRNRSGTDCSAPGSSAQGGRQVSVSSSPDDALQASSVPFPANMPQASSDTALESARQMAAKIRRQSEKLDFFIRELTKTSYAEQEMISIHPKRVSAAELIDKSCQGIELAAMKKNIHIRRMDAEHPGCVCFADPKWTVESLTNILENAIKYSPQSSTIEISVIPYEAFVCIEVKDHGIGIPESEQGAIFRRFYRSPQISDTPGFGIGLYLAREVLSRQGGYIKVQSAPGAGSTFQVFLSKLSPLRKI